MNRTEKRIPEVLGGIGKKAQGAWKKGVRRLRETRVAKVLGRPSVRDAAALALRCAGSALLGFLFGRCNLGFGVRPLGLALLLCGGKYTFFLYVGSAAAALTYERFALAFFGVNTLLYILRKLLLSDGFDESLKTRLRLAVGTGAFLVAATLLAAFFSSGDLSALPDEFPVAAAAYLLVLPAAVWLLYPAAAGKAFDGRAVNRSLLFFCMCLVLSLGFSLPHGRDAAVVLAVALTLAFCVCLRSPAALCAAALLGFSTLRFAVCAPLCVAAYLFCSHDRRRLSAYAAFLGAAEFLSLLCFDLSAPSAAGIPADILLGVLLFLPFDARLRSYADASRHAAVTPDAFVKDAFCGRMDAVSDAFRAVSGLCFRYAGRLRFPDEEESAALISVCSSRVCSRCQLGRTCKLRRLYADGALVAALREGRLSAASFPDKLRENCLFADAIADEISDAYKKLLTDRFNNNKTEILACEYNSIARILKYTSRLSSDDTSFDAALSRKASAATRRLGLPHKAAAACGKRKKTVDVSGVPVSAVHKDSASLAAFYSEQCDLLLDAPEYLPEPDGTFTLRFRSKEVIAVEYVKASHTRGGEVVCGDTVTFFKSDDSFFYALIADGMGSGRDAAMTSRLTSVFVEKLLCGGVGKGVTMELLNTLLMAKNKECFSTVDLLELDLLSRRASFVKAGAAPAYLLRSAKLFKVSSDTPPCGIVEGFCAENTGFDVMAGDLVVMLSDGITSSLDCGPSLCDVMTDAKNAPLQETANRILAAASRAAVHDDDMSCVLIRIK